MTRDEIQNVRDWINGTSTHDEFCDVMTLDDEYRHLPCSCGLSEAIAILDAELAKPEPEPEPVAYWNKECMFCRADEVSDTPNWTDYYPYPLYAAPPSREWQELSPLEMQDTLRNCAASTFDKLAPNWYEVRQFARAIESALKEKNHG